MGTKTLDNLDIRVGTAEQLSTLPANPDALEFETDGMYPAASVLFDNTGTSLQATDVQAAIKEIASTGLEGDYRCRYGVVAWPNGSPSIGTGNTVNIPAGLVLNVPGTVANPSTSLITLASAQTVTLTKTTNSLLVYVQGLDEIQQCDKICFSKTTPVDDDSTCQLWWNGQEMQFRSTDQGNIWVAVRAGILGELLYTEGSLTRINRVGWYHYLPETTGA